MLKLAHTRRQLFLVVALLSAFTAIARPEAPHVYAITGARIVTAAGAPIASGTVLVRGAFIQAVGTPVTVPPEAVVIDGKNLTVYPGLVDMGTAAGLDVPSIPAPRDPKTREEVERWKRQVILRPQIEAAKYVKADAPELHRLAAAGITTILAAPPGEVVKGYSSLLNVAAPEDEPQISAVTDERRGLYVVKTPVALHIALPSRPASNAYPASLMGVVAFVRQAFFDAAHDPVERAYYDRTNGTSRPAYDQTLDALQPVLTGKLPVAFEVSTARDILRALSLAKEFKLDPIIAGGQEADQISADLRATKARVVFSLAYPERPKTLGPGDDEPLRVLRQRAHVARVPAELDKAGLLFAFTSGGLKDPKDFVRNAARAVRAGLPAEAAIRALTINAATIAGAGDRLGSIEKGKIANLIVTDGDLFDEKVKITHVFVDGRPVGIAASPGGSR